MLRIYALRTRARVTTLTCMLLGIALGMFLSAGFLRGQAVWSTILGYVTDPSGGAIPDAVVTVTNEQTGVVQKASTDSEGSYNITHLDPGAYDLTVEKAGFNRYLQKGIQLAVTASVRADIKLEVGKVNQEVTVSAQAAQLETQNTQVATNFDTQQLSTLPVGKPISILALVKSYSRGWDLSRTATISIPLTMTSHLAWELPTG